MEAMFIIIALLFQTSTLEITSPDFDNDGRLPIRCTCDGDDVSPELNLKGIPKGTVSLALIVEDPDISESGFSHWLVWNITPAETILRNSSPGVQGRNSMGKSAYLGPCPTVGTHRYNFRVFALDRKLKLSPGTTKHDLEYAMRGHVLAHGMLTGKYSR